MNLPRVVCILVCLTGVAGATVGAAEETIDLDALMDERIQINRAYKAQYMDEAENAAQKKNEELVGEQWVVMCQRIKESGSDRLKAEFLKLEYLTEINDAQYDIDYAENMLETAAGKGQLAVYTKKMEDLQVWLAAQGE